MEMKPHRRMVLVGLGPTEKYKSLNITVLRNNDARSERLVSVGLFAPVIDQDSGEESSIEQPVVKMKFKQNQEWEN